MTCKRSAFSALLVLAAAALSGCPELQPAFDVTGTHEGLYSVGAGDLKVMKDCAMTLTLEQNSDGILFSKSLVTGSVTFDLSCVLGDDLLLTLGGLAAANPEIAAMAGLLSVGPFPLTGVVFPDGKMELHTTEDAPPTVTGVTAQLAFLGKAGDVDEDGRMDNYDGTWLGTFTVNGTVIPVGGAFKAPYIMEY